MRSPEPARDEDSSINRAPGTLTPAAVLENNWLHLHTVPATGLYPHQWSWDSAFIAIGWRHLSPRRAQQELESLFGAQWADGRLPQIVFDTSRDNDYSPGAAFWRSERLTGAPAVPTAGLVQPPMHAWAALLVHRADPVESRRRRFLARAYPALVYWHGYLAQRRDRDGSGLACVLHPWESGMDNAPAWDPVLAVVDQVRSADAEASRPDGDVPRPDLLHADPEERPSDTDYRNYLYLAARYRDHDCDDADAGFPFVVKDPAFNALWAVGELALAEIAAEVGADPQIHRSRANSIVSAMEALWDEDLGLFTPFDVTAGRRLRFASISGLIPLVLPGQPHAHRLLDTLRGPRFDLAHSILVSSYDRTAPEFDRARYWRGPSWFNMSWLVLQGLRQWGSSDEVTRLAGQLATWAPAGGYPEYLDPISGEPHGTRNFSWTAALALDVAHASDAGVAGAR